MEYLELKRGGVNVATWALTVIADQPPTIMRRNPGPRGDRGKTKLPWVVSDDYGVTQVEAELRLRDRPTAPPLALNIPLPAGSAKAAEGMSRLDLTAHPWAGLFVSGRLIGRDATGQIGRSSEEPFLLPERTFLHPVARQIIAARKSLSLDPDDRGDALAALDDLLQRPQLFAGDLGAFCVLSGTYYELARNSSSHAVSEAQDMMWQLANHLEERRDDQSARSLEAARRAARDALEMAERQPDISRREELMAKLSELRHALDQHLQSLMAEAKRDEAATPFDHDALQLSDKELRSTAGKLSERQRRAGYSTHVERWNSSKRCSRHFGIRSLKTVTETVTIAVGSAPKVSRVFFRI